MLDEVLDELSMPDIIIDSPYSAPKSSQLQENIVFYQGGREGTFDFKLRWYPKFIIHDLSLAVLKLWVVLLKPAWLVRTITDQCISL